MSPFGNSVTFSPGICARSVVPSACEIITDGMTTVGSAPVMSGAPVDVVRDDDGDRAGILRRSSP